MSVEERRRARALFDAALDREPAERRAFLAAACGQDETLRTEIEALLAAHERAEADEGAGPRESGEQPGERIGHYKLRQKIGEGGFGVVWMAEQEEPVRRKVALKVLKPGMDTAQVVARFEAERQALALMDHPNIAKVFDGGATPTGRPYFVMELVKGVPITKYCDDANLGMEQRLELFVPVCQAVQHAHQKGVIHRDIKPSNVLVTLHDGVAVPKVIDFGIAKATAARLTEKTVFTEFRQMLGTPEYMAPEQADLSGLDVDTRADIYSLGVLLYELLTGTRPFDLKTLLQVGYAEMLRTIKEVDPPKPSTRVSTLGEQVTGIAKQRHVSPKALSALMRGDLDWIVMRCLEKDRGSRYETATALAEDVQRHLSHEPVLAGPPSRAYRLRKYVRRNRLAVAAGGAIAASLLAGAIASGLGYVEATEQAAAARAAERQAEDERAAAVEARDAEAKQREAAETARAEAEEQSVAARREAAKARMVGELLSAMLSSSDPHEDKGRDYPVRMVLADFERSLGARLQGEPEVEAELRRVVGKSYLGLGMVDSAEPHLQRVLELKSSLFGDRHPETAQARFDLARVLHARGQHEAALAALQRVEEGPAVERPDDALANRVSLLASRCDNLRHLGRLREAEEVGREALSLAEGQGGAHGALADLPRSCLARTLMDLGRFTEAEPLFRQCLATGLDAGADSSVDRTNLAAVLCALDRIEEAEALLHEALEADRKRLGDEHPEIARVLCSLGAVLHRKGNLDAAADVLTEALQMLRKFLGEEHATVADSIYSLAVVQRSRGDNAGAERLHQEALTMRRKLLGDMHPDVAQSLSGLAALRWEIDQLGDAEDSYRRAIEIRLQAGQARHPQTARDMAQLGVVLQQRAALGQRRQSSEPEQLFRKALDVEQESLGPEHTYVVEDLNNLAMTLLQQGDFTEAEPVARQAWTTSRRVFGEDSQEAVRAAGVLGYVLFRGQRGSQLGEARALLELAAAQPSSASPDLARELNNQLGVLGAIQYDSGDYASAIETYRRVLETWRQAGEAGYPVLDDTRMLLRALTERGEWAEAEPVARQVLEMQSATLGAHHPETLEPRVLLARSLAKQGKEAESAAATQQVSELITTLLSQGGATSAGALAWLGDRLLRWDEVEECARRIGQAEELLARTPDREKPASLTAHVQVMRAFVLLLAGDPAAAEPYARRSLEIRQRIAAGTFGHYSAMGALGRALADQGKLAEAEPLLVEACSRMDPPFQGRDKLRAALTSLVRLYEAQGKAEQAAAWREKLAAFDAPSESGK